MTLTLKEVEHIATLARLELNAQEKARYQVQLSAILEHVAKLQKLDTTGIPPTASMLSKVTPLRTDEARPGLDTAELFKNASQTEDNQFKIPPVFE